MPDMLTQAQIDAGQDLVDALRECIEDARTDLKDMTESLRKHSEMLEAVEGQAEHMQNAVNLARQQLAEFHGQAEAAAEVPDGR